MTGVRGVDAQLLKTRYRLTKQRSAVLRALESGGHLSAETILERVHAELPGVSLGTIYRTLDILRELGLVQAFTFAGGAARFEAALVRHHHLLCRGCGALTDIDLPQVELSARSVGAEHDYTDTEGTLTVTGICPSCRTA